MFAGNFAPAGWMFCEGQSLPISENETLFQLIGTTYGGDGQNTFALPDLRGRAPVHMGQGPGISQNYQMGELGGLEMVTLTTTQIAAHNHALVYGMGSQASPAVGLLGVTPARDFRYSSAAVTGNMPASTLQPAGGSQPHENRSPYLALSYIISLFGIFPSPT